MQQSDSSPEAAAVGEQAVQDNVTDEPPCNDAAQPAVAAEQAGGAPANGEPEQPADGEQADDDVADGDEPHAAPHDDVDVVDLDDERGLASADVRDGVNMRWVRLRMPRYLAGRGTISYHFWYNFLSLVFCPYFAVFCRIFRNTLYSAVF